MLQKQTKKAVISSDFDDVLMHFNGGFIPFHNERYGTSVKFEECYTYDMEAIYGCDHQTAVQRVREFYESEHHENTEVIPGAQAGMATLSEKYALHLLTSRAETLRPRTSAWLERHFPNTFECLHFTNGFGAHHTAHKRSKPEVCHEIGAVLHIEDAPKQVCEVAESGIPVLMPHKPWNANVLLPKNATRVHSWDDIITWVHANL